jgi:hypothetical protein
MPLRASYRLASSEPRAVAVTASVHSATPVQREKAVAFRSPSFEGDLPTRVFCKRQRLLANSIAVGGLPAIVSRAQFTGQKLRGGSLPPRTFAEPSLACLIREGGERRVAHEDVRMRRAARLWPVHLSGAIARPGQVRGAEPPKLSWPRRCRLS